MQILKGFHTASYGVICFFNKIYLVVNKKRTHSSHIKRQLFRSVENWSILKIKSASVEILTLHFIMRFAFLVMKI